MRAALVLLAMLAGCNQVLGLDTTRAATPTADFDGDGIPNVDDNCPTVPNPDQADADGDQLGDACDPCPLGPESGIDADRDGIDDACDACPRGPNHDEDGDGIFDACDDCPAVADPDQANADGDDLGDACDLDSTSVQHRGYFDGFGVLTDAWTSLFPWQIVNDAIEPVPLDSPSLLVRTLWNPDGSYTDLDHIEITVDATSAPLGAGVGVALADVPGTLDRLCELVSTTGGWELEGGNTNAPITTLPEPAVLRVRLTSTTFICELAGGPSVMEPDGGAGPYSVQLVTNVIAPFAYVDVIRR